VLRYVCLFLLLAPLWAQAPSASVVGRVVDCQRSRSPGVAVKITNLDTNQTYRAVSNGAGDFTSSI